MRWPRTEATVQLHEKRHHLVRWTHGQLKAGTHNIPKVFATPDMAMALMTIMTDGAIILIASHYVETCELE